MSTRQMIDVARNARVQVSGWCCWTSSQPATTANPPPTGTPVCFTEKTSGAYLSGL